MRNTVRQNPRARVESGAGLAHETRLIMPLGACQSRTERSRALCISVDACGRHAWRQSFIDLLALLPRCALAMKSIEKSELNVLSSTPRRQMIAFEANGL
jgi:hypothetical protein